MIKDVGKGNKFFIGVQDRAKEGDYRLLSNNMVFNGNRFV